MQPFSKKAQGAALMHVPELRLVVLQLISWCPNGSMVHAVLLELTI